MAHALAKGVAVTFGLLTTSSSVFNAIEKSTSGNKQVCDGYGLTKPTEPGGEPQPRKHAVMLISQPKTCPECGEIPYTAVKKGQPVGDGYVLLESAEIAEAKADATAFKKRVDLTPHPAEQVEGATVPGEKLYHLAPDAGHESTYALLVEFIGAHPELAFMGQWTPRSNASQFRVSVREGVLVLQERVRAENVKATPVLTLPEVNPAYLAMAETLIAAPGMVSAYDPATYADTYKDKIAVLVASKEVLAAAVTETSAAPAAGTVPVGDTMAALQAMLAQAGAPTLAAVPTPAPKKRAAKKTAKKAAMQGAA